jgi:hypothetical protein
MKKDNSKVTNLIRSGNNLRKKECGNFWDDFLNLFGNVEATAELLDIPKEKITKWFGIINKLRNEVRIIDSNSSKQKNKIIKTGDIKMKSIREWLAENNMDMDMSDTQELGLAKQFSGTGVKVNTSVANLLKNPLERAIAALKEEDPRLVLKEIMAIVIRQIFNVHNTKITQSMVRDVLDEIEIEQEGEGKV